jgi:general secretion pathway protein D
MNRSNKHSNRLASFIALFLIATLALFALLPGIPPASRARAQATEQRRRRVPPRARTRPLRRRPRASQQQEEAKPEPEKAEDKKTEAPAEDILKPYENLTGIPYKPSAPGKRITFNLEGADLPDLVRLISQLTGKRFIMPSKLRSIQATVYAPTKVTIAEAYQAFLSILELNGMGLVPAGRYLKIVESGGIENKPIRLQTDGDGVPRGDTFLTRLQPLEHITAEDAAELLGRFKSADGNITAYAPSNMLIITDTGTNMNRMMRILGVIDVPRTSEHIWVEPVHYANASEMAQSLSEIFEPEGKGTTASKRKAAPRRAAKGKAAPASSTVGSRKGESRITKILADERTNSLIILATEPAYLRILEMLRHLDIPMEGEGRIHVHYLQHSDADEIAGTLSKLVGKNTGTKGKKGASEGAEIFEGTIALTAHKASNALVITSSAHDYAALRKTIDRLDIERRQVFIEAVIMELNVNRSSNLGLSFHGGIPGFPTDDSFGVVGFDAGRTVGGLLSSGNADMLTGLAVGVQGQEIETNTVGLSVPAFGVALRAMASSSDANILSTPHLIAMDNVEAEITVGENVPLQTSTVPNYGSLTGLAGLTGTQQTSAAGLSALAGLGYGGAVPRQDVGTTIKITPHINESDGIRLEISEEISSAGAPSDSGNLGVVSIQRTRAKTEVAVGDQQTVVIGGLMRDAATNAESKVPILGDIPLLGVLFRSRAKSKVKRNLVLFLTPYIIRSPGDLRAIYDRKMRERQEFLDRYFVFTSEAYEPPVDYSRTRGLVSEMLAEIAVLDEQRKMIEEAKAKPPPEHVSQPPVGDLDGEGDDGDLIIEGDEEAETGPSEPAPAPQGPRMPVPPPAGEEPIE